MCKRAFDSVHLYMDEVMARVVAKTGIPSDRYHIGKLILNSMEEELHSVLQIDGATGESETNASALNRSIRCAISLTNMGLKTGDVMVLMAPNHLDYCIPHCAAMYLGIMVASIDATLYVDELKALFATNLPNIIFCQSAKTADVENALNLAKVNAKIVTFDNDSNYTTLAQLLDVKDEEAIKNFKATDFDPTETVAFLTSTSGTTGVPKTAMLTHKNLSISITYVWIDMTKFPTPTRLAIVVSPGQWLTAGFHYLFSSVMKYPRLQTSATVTPEHFAELVNKYKPTYILCSPTLMTNFAAKSKCDFSCFKNMSLAGSYVSQELVDKMKILTKSEDIYIMYGMSELGGPAFIHDFPPTKPGSLGRPIGALECKLVNPTTNEVITEPFVHGELWFKGPVVFKGYHNNPEVTSQTITEDGWLKSGDIFYRDESWNIFYVERLKSLLKYKNHQVSPVEIENVIMKHPGVLHVAVTGIPDKECGDLVVACVVPKHGCKPTAQEIKDLVKESLTDSKQLRGGVIFMNELPVTSSSKINRQKLQELVRTMHRE